MSYPGLSHQPVATLDTEARGQFVVDVYRHLLLAIGAFVAFEAVLFATGIANAMLDFFVGSGGIAWLLLLGLFTGASWITTNMAHAYDDPQRQYLGLAGIAGAEALLFAPFLALVFQQDGAGTVGAAAFVSLLGFACLTVVAFTTRKDLSGLGRFIGFGFLLAIVAIVGGVLFGFQLGLWFSVAMVGLAGATILYKTQQIMATYPNVAAVGAAVELFGSIMLLFWYVLRIFSSRN